MKRFQAAVVVVVVVVLMEVRNLVFFLISKTIGWGCNNPSIVQVKIVSLTSHA